MSQFWCEFLEFIYMPIFNVLGYDSLLSALILITFIWFQFFIIRICILKPFSYLFRALLSMFFGGEKNENN